VATRSQKVKVGLFLVICFVLMVAGIMIVSGYKHEELIPYWIEFDESVLGLSTGGTVEYLGVPVGTVKDIYVTEDGRAHVDILVAAEKVTLHKGVQAKLALYSLATGVLVVMLDGGDTAAPELPANSQIPEIPSLVEAVSSRVETILDDLGETLKTVRNGLEGMEEGDINRTAKNFDELINDGRKFVDDLNTTLNDLKGDAEAGMANFRKLTEDLQDVVENVNATLETLREKIAQLKLGDTEGRLRGVLDSITKLVEQLNKTIATIDTVSRSALHEVDNVEYGLRETLRTATETLESIKKLSDSIDEDPVQILRGKGKPAGGD